MWDASSGDQLVVVRLLGSISAPARLNSVAFTADRTRVLTAGCDGNAQVWDVETHVPKVKMSHGPGLAVWTAVYSPANGDQILTASNDNTARLWTASGNPLLLLPLGETVSSAAFSADVSRAVTASADGVASFLDLTRLLVERPPDPAPHPFNGAGVCN